MQDLHEACCPKGRLPKLPTELLNWCANDDTPKISSACSSCLGVLFDNPLEGSCCIPNCLLRLPSASQPSPVDSNKH